MSDAKQNKLLVTVFISASMLAKWAESAQYIIVFRHGFTLENVSKITV